MKKYKILPEFKTIGNEKVFNIIELLPSGLNSSISGVLINVGDMNINMKKLPVVITGDFEITYKWQNYTGHWNSCDQVKYLWAKRHKHAVGANFKYIGECVES